MHDVVIYSRKGYDAHHVDCASVHTTGAEWKAMEEIHPHVQYLMKVGGFKTFDEYLIWTREPLEDWDEPDWGELALREMGCFESGSGDDNDPNVLAYMQEYSEAYLQEKEDRLIREHGGGSSGDDALIR